MKQNEHIGKVKGLVNGYKSTYIMITAARIGIFNVLNDKPKLLSDIAEAIHIENRKVEPILNALAHYEIIEKSDSGYTMIEFSDVLSPCSPISQLGYINHALNMSDKWRKLEDVIKTDITAVSNFKGITGDNESATRAFLEAMNANATSQAAYLVNKFDFTDHKFIDIGAGYGTYSLAIAKTYPTAEGIVLDLPMAARIIDENIIASNLSNQLEAVAGNYKDTLPQKQFDDVLLFAVIHQEKEEEVQKLLKSVFDILKDGGRLYLTSFFLEDNKTEPQFSVLFGVEMLVGSEFGKAYSHSEIKKMLEVTGFKNIEKISDIPGPATLYIATK